MTTTSKPVTLGSIIARVPCTYHSVLGRQGHDQDCIRCALESYAQREQELRDAAKALLRKLDQVGKDTAGMFVMAHVHGQGYKVANCGEEYQALTALLGKE